MVHRHTLALILLAIGGTNAVPLPQDATSEDGGDVAVVNRYGPEESLRVAGNGAGSLNGAGQDHGAASQQTDPFLDWMQMLQNPQIPRPKGFRPKSPGGRPKGAPKGPRGGRSASPVNLPPAAATQLGSSPVVPFTYSTQTITIIGGTMAPGSTVPYGGTTQTGDGLTQTITTTVTLDSPPGPKTTVNPRPSPRPTTPSPIESYSTIPAITIASSTVSTEVPITLPALSSTSSASDDDFLGLGSSRSTASVTIESSSASGALESTSAMPKTGIDSSTPSTTITAGSSSASSLTGSAAESGSTSPIATPPPIPESSKTGIPSSVASDTTNAAPIVTSPSVPKSSETGISFESLSQITSTPAMITVVTLPGATPASSTISASLSLATIPDPILVTPAPKSTLTSISTPLSMASSSPVIAGSTSFNVTCPRNDAMNYSASNGKAFKLECYTDHLAGDLSLVWDVGSWGSCANACAAVPACVGFSWAPGPASPCYLKSSVSPGRMKQSVWGGRIVSGGNSTAATATASPMSTRISTMPLPVFTNSTGAAAPMITVVTLPGSPSLSSAVSTSSSLSALPLVTEVTLPNLPASASSSFIPPNSLSTTVPLVTDITLPNLPASASSSFMSSFPPAVNSANSPTTFITIPYTTSFTDTLNWGGPVPISFPVVTATSSIISVAASDVASPTGTGTYSSSTFSESFALDTITPAPPAITASITNSVTSTIPPSSVVVSSGTSFSESFGLDTVTPAPPVITASASNSVTSAIPPSSGDVSFSTTFSEPFGLDTVTPAPPLTASSATATKAFGFPITGPAFKTTVTSTMTVEQGGFLGGDIDFLGGDVAFGTSGTIQTGWPALSTGSPPIEDPPTVLAKATASPATPALFDNGAAGGNMLPPGYLPAMPAVSAAAGTPWIPDPVQHPNAAGGNMLPPDLLTATPALLPTATYSSYIPDPAKYPNAAGGNMLPPVL